MPFHSSQRCAFVETPVLLFGIFKNLVPVRATSRFGSSPYLLALTVTYGSDGAQNSARSFSTYCRLLLPQLGELPTALAPEDPREPARPRRRPFGGDGVGRLRGDPQRQPLHLRPPVVAVDAEVGDLLL